MGTQVVSTTELFSLVQAIFSGQILDIRFAPDLSSCEGEKVLGIITDPAVKAFFSEAKTPGITDETRHLLSSFFWEGVLSKFPGSNRGVRTSWRVVSCGSSNHFPPREVSPGMEVSAAFFEDVRWALSVMDEDDSKIISCSDAGMPINDMDEEFIVGEISTPAVKALGLIKIGLERAIDKFERESLNSLEDWDKITRLNQQLTLVGKLFWTGVRKDLPAVAKNSLFALRRGWTIVRVPKKVNLYNELHVPNTGLYKSLSVAVLQAVGDEN